MAQHSQSSSQVSDRSQLATKGLNAWWGGLSTPQRHSYLAILLGFVAFVLLIGQLPFAQPSWAAALGAPLAALLGWGVWLFLPGILITCGIVFYRAFAGRRPVRVLPLGCLGVALVLLLVESRLLLGAPVGGLIGWAGARGLAHVAGGWGQLVIWGSLALDALLYFGISWHHVGRTARAMQRSAQPIDLEDPELLPLTPYNPRPDLSVPLTAHSSMAVNAPTPQMERSTVYATLTVGPQTERTVILPASMDYHAESTLEALRVPAYLRRGLTGVLSSAATPSTSGEFALPPLPGTLREPPTIMLGAHALPPLPQLPSQAMSIERSGKPAPRPITPERTVVRHSQPITWSKPPLQLLNPASDARSQPLREQAERMAATIERTLKSFGVEAEVRRADISVGPTIMRFGVRPTERVRKDERGRVMVDANGQPLIVRTRVSRILNLKDDLALALAVKTLRMEAPVPERPYVGIEIPNVAGRMVTLREMLESREFVEAAAKSKLAVALGRDVAGRVRVGDLARFPHVLIAGATGAGKSVCLSALIGSLITQATPDEVRRLLIDPKMVELTLYAGMPHLLTPVITDARRAADALQAAITEMERRYRLLAKVSVRNLESYEALRTSPNGATLEKLPRIVIVIDDLADLMLVAPDAIERHICRLAQLARAVGIHLIVATQRPSVDVITGLIKANIPTRIAFMVASAVDSRTILDRGGAEQLLGKGDMLFLASDAPKAERMQGVYVADDEAERLALLTGDFDPLSANVYVADDEAERLAHFWSAQASALGIIPAQWSLPGNDADELFPYADEDLDEPVPAWQRAPHYGYDGRD